MKVSDLYSRHWDKFSIKCQGLTPSSIERNLIIYLFAINPRYKMVEKGKFLGISGDTVSKGSKRFINKLRIDKVLNTEVELIRRKLYG